LFAAIKAGNLPITEELLQHETEEQINFTNNPLKDTALHLAAREQDNDMMKLFMKLGAGIDVQNVILLNTT
jgi:ankyrin repeat protein